MDAEPILLPRDYRRILTKRAPVVRSSENARPGDLILARDRTVRVSNT